VCSFECVDCSAGYVLKLSSSGKVIIGIAAFVVVAAVLWARRPQRWRRARRRVMRAQDDRTMKGAPLTTRVKGIAGYFQVR
jgi:hypothetical protein